MRAKVVFTSLLLVSVILSGCSILTNFGVKVITPSTTIISENRDVSGYNAINFSTFGKVNIMQGDKELLNISGPDNLVPEITTTVSNGTLTIKNKDNISVTSLNAENMLTFTVVVKDLTSLTISGAGDVQVETLSTPSMDLTLSGAGSVQMNQLATQSLNVKLSGAGSLTLSGTAPQTTIDISGAGSLNAPDLQIQTANVTISGLGGATVWVTNQLTGKISGAGSVSYYGTPQTSTNASGLGQFKALGNK